MPSLRMGGAVTPLAHITSWRAQGLLYIYICLYLCTDCTVVDRTAIRSVRFNFRHRWCECCTSVNRRCTLHVHTYTTWVSRIHLSLCENAGSMFRAFPREKWNVGSSDETKFVASEDYKILLSLRTTHNVLIQKRITWRVKWLCVSDTQVK